MDRLGSAALRSPPTRGARTPARAPGDKARYRWDTRAAMKQQRLTAAKASPFASRIEAELASFERRLKDAREYGWLGTDAGVLSAELEELEQKLGRAEREQQASAALASVDARRTPLSERVKKAIMEGTAV